MEDRLRITTQAQPERFTIRTHIYREEKTLGGRHLNPGWRVLLSADGQRQPLESKSPQAVRVRADGMHPVHPALALGPSRHAVHRRHERSGLRGCAISGCPQVEING